MLGLQVLVGGVSDGLVGVVGVVGLEVLTFLGLVGVVQPEGLTSGGLVGVVQYWQFGVQGFKVFLPFPPNKQESFATIPGVLHNTPSTPAPAVPTADNGDMHIVVLTLVGIW